LPKEDVPQKNFVFFNVHAKMVPLMFFPMQSPVKEFRPKNCQKKAIRDGGYSEGSGDLRFVLLDLQKFKKGGKR
jgi:hypothetical protein